MPIERRHPRFPCGRSPGAVGRSRLRRSPGRRAVESATVGADRDLVRQLALRGKVTGDVPAKGGESTKLDAIALMWVEHDSRFPESSPRERECGAVVGIPANQNDGVAPILIDVGCDLNREIDVGLLLLCLPHGGVRGFVAGKAGFLHKGHPGPVSLVAPFDDFDQGILGECLKVDGLVMGRDRHVPFAANARREVFDLGNLILRRQQLSREFLKVEPLPGRVAKKPVVKVVSVNVDNGFHVATVEKTLEPGLLPAPHRIAVAQRVNVAHQGADTDSIRFFF